MLEITFKKKAYFHKSANKKVCARFNPVSQIFVSTFPTYNTVYLVYHRFFLYLPLLTKCTCEYLNKAITKKLTITDK